MPRVFLAIAIVLLIDVPLQTRTVSEDTAVLSAAIEAMGGPRLSSLGTLRLDVIGHEWALEQSERPEGPWFARYFQRHEIRDIAGSRLRRSTQTRDWNFAQWSPSPPSVTIVSDGIAARANGDRWAPGLAADIADAAEVFALSPERILITARDAADLKSQPGRQLHGVAQEVLAFTWRTQAITLFLNRHTHLPTMVEVVKDDPMGVWGDVTERRWFSFWTLEAGGLWYPRQTTVDWNGYPYRDSTVMDLAVDGPVEDSTFAIPDDARRAFEAAAGRPFGIPSLRLDESRATELAPGIVQLAGPWNVLVVRQPDGLVILEAPISADYSRDVMAAAERRFPGVPIKAIVTTSDAWPHIGGVREYVARRLPVHALDLNIPILERLVRASRSRRPDMLARTPAPPRWARVADRQTIGTGELRIELIPVRGEVGERMLMAWLPERKLLYASDLIQRNRSGGFFMPGMLAEVLSAVEREHLGTPERVIAMHLAATPWTEIVAAVERVRTAAR